MVTTCRIQVIDELHCLGVLILTGSTLLVGPVSHLGFVSNLSMLMHFYCLRNCWCLFYLLQIETYLVIPMD